MAVAPARALAHGGAGPGIALRQAFAAGPVGAYGRPGVPAPAPSAQALSGTLEQATGVTPAEVRTVDVCPAPAPGTASCAAQALVLRSNGERVRPRVRRFATPRVGPGAAAPTVAGPAIAPATSPPTAGTPAYLQEAYDLTYLSQTAGGSDTVAIVDAYNDPNAEADLGTYRTSFGLPACTTVNGCFRKVNENGKASPLPAGNSGWEEEESLDLDSVSALCPNCHILFIEANSSSWSDLTIAEATAASLGAEQISNSFAGASSSALPASGFSFPGVAVIAATGDSGYVGPGYDSYPAGLAGVTAAGGTTLTAASGGQGARGFGESAWSLSNGEGGGSGCDLQVAKPSYQTDTGCTGRSYADVSADANPNTGMAVYDSGNGGWLQVGGTSMATPLIAAYYALTGVTTTTAQWAYTESSLLNDPTTGSNGTCAAAISYICNAGVGYDGPTGAGSISGAVAVGGPGIGGPADGTGANNTYDQSVNSTGATLTGGVYPNGLDTTWWVQYGTTNAYGQATTPADIGSGQAPVSVTGQLSSLAPSTTYHYRLVAQNSAGTTYGYDYTLTTLAPGASPPANAALPTLTGTASQGQTLSATTGTWSPTATAYAYQWQRSTDGGTTWTNISGATSATYSAGAGDGNAYLRVVVTASNSNGQSSATSASVGPVALEVPVDTTAPSVTGATVQGQTLVTNPGAWSPAATAYAYQWQRSADGTTWTTITGATGASYLLGIADIGSQIRVLVTGSNQFGSAAGAVASSAVGPVTSGAPFNTAAPVISGTADQGSTLSASTGTWSPAGTTYNYQWQLSADGGNTWASISGATQSSYALIPADVGSDVRVAVTATNPYGVTALSSALVGPVVSVPPVNSVAPAITGTDQRGYTLTAGPGTWSGTGDLFTYQWQRSTDGGNTWASISGATTATYTVAVADEAALLRVAVTATDSQGTATLASAPTTMIAPFPPANTAVPTITGAAQRASILTGTPGVWTGSQNTYTYQWQEDFGEGFANIAGATGLQYTLGTADEGAVVRLVVTATNPDGVVMAPSAATATVPSSPPVNTTLPTVAGTAQRGSTLTATQGAWTGIGNTYTYQWQNSPDGSTWTNVSGATGGTYPLTQADETFALRVVVTATNPDATVTATSAATAVVPASPPVNSAVPVVTGTAQRTSVLTATQGTWSGVGNTYSPQWQRSTDGGNTWSAIGGATTDTYTLGFADEASEVRMLVTVVNADGTATAASAPTGTVVGAVPVNTAAPTISGSAQRGTTLSSTPGTWGGLGNSYAYQWQRSTDGGTTWAAITGATATSYTLAVADETAAVRLLVTATNADGSAAVPSPATAVVQSSPPVNTAAPTVSGIPTRTGVLTATQGTWSGAGNAYAYQWQSSTDGGTTWNAITGATAGTYTLAVSDEGAKVRVLVTATNADATAGAISLPTATVAAAPPVNTAAPTITGTVQRTGVLTAAAGTWGGIGNAYTDQWQRSTDGTTWTNISGATAASYTITAADEGAVIRVLVTATNPDAAVSAASAATTTVTASPPSSTGLPVVTGSAQRASVLSTTTGSWTGLGNTLSIQWQENSGSGYTNIAGATSATYTLGVADEGSAVRVVVTATNADGTATATSAATATVIAAPPVNTAAPSLTGTVQRTGALTVSLGTWGGVGNTYTDQWQRSSDGITWTNISGATATTYTIGTADEGSMLRAVVTATNPDASVGADTPATTTVAASPPSNSTVPTVSGTAQRASTLTATQGTWGGLANGYNYQWQHSLNGGTTWTAIGGANTASYTLGVSDEGSLLRILVTATNADGSASATSVATTTIAAVPPANTNLPTVSGTAQRTGILSANPGGWSGAGNTYAYQWQHSSDGGVTWAPITGATSATYSLGVADEGTELRMLVTATNPDGAVSAASAASATVIASPPVNTAVPTVVGIAQRTDTLTATLGTWGGYGNAYTYQWQRSGDGGNTWTAISGATATTYTIAQADEGTNLRVVVTATNPDGPVSVASAATSAVVAAPPVNTTPPSVGGSARLGATLTAQTGAWTPATPTFTYQWQSSANGGTTWTGVIGATGATYTLAQSDVGNMLRVIITATNIDGTTSATSPASAIVAQPPQNTVAPAAPSGTLMNSYTLTADHGTWDTAGVTYAYAWMRCAATATAITSTCTQVGSAPTYVLTVGDVGSTIGVSVMATSAGGSTSANGALTGVVAGLPLTNTALPVISGTPQVAQTLSASEGSWSVPTLSVTYTWNRCDATGANCAAIATGTQYLATTADLGHTIVLSASVTSPGRTATAQSPPLTIQALPVPQNTSAPTISGVAERTAALTVAPGSWTNEPTLSYQWQRCNATGGSCQSIVGATATTYTLAKADEGSTITVVVTATNGAGSSSASASPTGVVAAIPPVNTHLPVLVGQGSTIQQGTPVSITAVTWNANSETTYSSIFERCNASGGNCQVLPGTTSGRYTPVAADVGQTLVAVVTATNPDGSVPATSAASSVVLPAAPRWKTLPIMSADPGQVGDTITVTPATWSGPTVTIDTVQMMRCTNSCIAVGAADATSYTIVNGDVGAILRVRETASDSGGSTVLWTSSYVGPVTSVSAGFAVVGAGQSAVRNADGAALATAQLNAMSVAADVHIARVPGRTIKLRRARGIRGPMHAWACPVAVPSSGPPLPCTAPMKLGLKGVLKVPASMTGKIRVIVVRGARPF